MMGNMYVFQISGIKSIQIKGDLLKGIRQLNGTYIGGSVYNKRMTHLIVTESSSSEKFIAACAGGKWIVSPDYVLDSVKHQRWLPEASYELNLTAGLQPPVTNPLKKWRKKVTRGDVSGAFQGWVVRLEIKDPERREMFKRILKAGKAVVCTDSSSTQGVTLVLTKGTVRTSQSFGVPRHNVSYIAKHLFGPVCSDSHLSTAMKKWYHGESSTQAEVLMEDESTVENVPLELEETLSSYIAKMELRKRSLLKVPELFSYYSPVFGTQTRVDFSNVWSLVECCLFPQALEELQGSLRPGVLPPAQVLQTCLQHALNGEGEPYYLNMLSTVLNDILCTNPTWSSPGSVKYFLQILQCPECKSGAWSFLQTSVRYCTASTSTCHSFPSPAPPELLRFHGDLQAFFLRLFKVELHAASSRTRQTGSRRASVLSTMFWSVWEKSSLSSRALQQLAELLVETVHRTPLSSQDCRLLVTLQEMLTVVVEYWAQENEQLNSRLVEKGFQDLTEYIAILCQDLPPDSLKELLPGIPSPRLKLYIADAIYRNVCCRNGLSIQPEPLSLHKIVSSYVKALGRLCGRSPIYVPNHEAERSPSSVLNSQVTDSGDSGCVGGSGLGKENVPRGFYRVNPAGETLLHRACKRNQVETVLHCVSVPGTDVNVKDHAGWTALHEACNHGSSECVEILLQHCPGLQLDSQVEGVSPLHDALLNQHTHIAKMLLRHSGSELLNLRDNFGRTPLDLVSSKALREELQRCAGEGDLVLEARCSEVRDLAFVEASSCLLSCLLLAYLMVHHIPTNEAPGALLGLTPPVAQTLVRLKPGALGSKWENTVAVSLGEDLRTLMNMEHHVLQVSPALKQCQGTHTSLFMRLLRDLQEEGTAMLNGVTEL